MTVPASPTRSATAARDDRLRNWLVAEVGAALESLNPHELMRAAGRCRAANALPDPAEWPVDWAPAAELLALAADAAGADGRANALLCGPFDARASAGRVGVFMAGLALGEAIEEFRALPPPQREAAVAAVLDAIAANLDARRAG